MNVDDLVFLILFIAVAVAFYLLPTIIAFSRQHHYRWIIFAINAIAGATVIGFLVALVWALWPKETALLDPFHGDPVTAGREGGRRVYERRGEYKSAAKSGEQWYYAVEKNVQGPVSRSKLMGLVMRGELATTDLAWKEGMSGWERVGDVISLPQ